MRVLDRYTNSKNPDLNGLPRTVEYSLAEMEASDRFNLLLDQNRGVISAAQDALLAMPPEERSAAFAEWLSEGHLTVDSLGLVVQHHGRG